MPLRFGTTFVCPSSLKFADLLTATGKSLHVSSHCIIRIKEQVYIAHQFIKSPSSGTASSSVPLEHCTVWSFCQQNLALHKLYRLEVGTTFHSTTFHTNYHKTILCGSVYNEYNYKVPITAINTVWPSTR